MFCGPPQVKEGSQQAQATEEQDQHATQRELLQLQADQQDGDRRGTWNQAAGQSEHDDLAGGHGPVGEAPLDVLGMGTLMRVREPVGSKAGYA